MYTTLSPFSAIIVAVPQLESPFHFPVTIVAENENSLQCGRGFRRYIITADSIWDSIWFRIVTSNSIQYSIWTQTADLQVPTLSVRHLSLGKVRRSQTHWSPTERCQQSRIGWRLLAPSIIWTGQLPNDCHTASTSHWKVKELLCRERGLWWMLSMTTTQVVQQIQFSQSVTWFFGFLIKHNHWT